MPGPNSAHAVAVRSEETREAALRLRMMGATYKQIGDKLGITRQGAHYIVNQVLKEIRETTNELAIEIIEIEAQRLDRMQAGIWADATSGNLLAIDRVLKIMERRAKLLGLDKARDEDIIDAIPVINVMLSDAKESAPAPHEDDGRNSIQ